MSILLNKDTRVVVQGITGHQGAFHSKAMLEFGTKVVAGVTPGKGGTRINGIPVYDDVRTAVSEKKANTSVVFVPAEFARDAVIEAIDAGIKLITVITEHVPSHDMLELLYYSKVKDARIIGPNCPGISVPGISKVGIMPNQIFKKGKMGIMSRSGTLTYEIVNLITEAGLGESTVVGIGGDTIPGTNFTDCLSLFENDKDTSSVVLVGEIGGTAEEDAAEFISKNLSKPVFAYIAGRYAPEGKRMGHAGAIILHGRGTAESKIRALKEAGVKVANTPQDLIGLLKRQGA